MEHICFLTGMFPRYDSLIFERQGQSMAKAGFKVTVVVCDLLPDEVINGVEIISAKFKPGSRIERILKAKKDLFKIAVACDAQIYQISEPELISTGLALKKRGKKVIYNMRENSPADMMYKEYLPRPTRKAARFFLESYMKRSLKKFDAVFSVTPELVGVASAKWGIVNAYLLTNYPIVDVNYQLSLQDYQKREDRLCYFGTVYKTSRQEHVFAALERLPGVRYAIAGVLGAGAEFLTHSPYWQRVEFIQGFQRKELPDILKKCTMSNVIRDYSESGTPRGSLGVIKMFESMEAALPVICSDVPVNRRIIKKYRCGLCIDPNDPDKIGEAIKYLVDNKEVAYRMGQNGRRAVLEEYNWNNQFRLYYRIIKGILCNDYLQILD